MKTPVLLITFNRPDHVRTVLSSLQAQQPSELYIAQDGPRLGKEDEPALLKVRSIVEEMVNWPCQLHTLYQDKNLGCGRGPYEAISWFFRSVEYGIILEDDINPHPVFYKFIEEVLEKYKDNPRVGMVTGHNLQRQYYGSKSYYFTSMMAGTLGWGTWRRVWEHFEFDIPYSAITLDESLKQYYHYPQELRKKLVANYALWLSTSRHDCWDYQFDYYLTINGYLNARANSCLTSHEGDSADATHGGFQNPNYKMDVNEKLFEAIEHPSSVRIHNRVYLHIYLKTLKSILIRWKNTIKFK